MKNEGCRVQGVGFRVQGSGCGFHLPLKREVEHQIEEREDDCRGHVHLLEGLGLRVSGFGFRV